MPRMAEAQVQREYKKAEQEKHPQKKTSSGVVELGRVAYAAAYLIEQKVLKPDSFRQCLTVWVAKHYKDDVVLARMAATMTLEQARA
jgi:hypothetical protein